MSKRHRDRKIDFRLAEPLYIELEAEAAANGMPSISAHIRWILIDHVVVQAEQQRDAA